LTGFNKINSYKEKMAEGKRWQFEEIRKAENYVDTGRHYPDFPFSAPVK
jgi:hypothetical protein